MVEWSHPAKNDLKQIYDFIACDSKYYAKKVSSEMVDKTKILKKFPRLGRIVPEINNESIREIFHYSYRIIYEIKNQKIDILALVHSKQDFSSGDFDEIRK
jgi:toxin ParE1/3/4